MTDKELKDIAVRIQLDGWTGCAVPLLRSIEISALREARELVEKTGDDDGLGVQSILSALTRKITHLELRQ